MGAWAAPPEEQRCRAASMYSLGKPRCMRRSVHNGYCWQHRRALLRRDPDARRMLIEAARPYAPSLAEHCARLIAEGKRFALHVAPDVWRHIRGELGPTAGPFPGVLDHFAYRTGDIDVLIHPMLERGTVLVVVAKDSR